METRANYGLIGLFTVATIVGAFGFVYWFQNLGGAGERVNYQVVFTGTVSGLRTGAAVLYNGLRVGEVADLRLDPQASDQVVATVSIDKSVPVRADTRVGLDFQGLTGIASLSMAGGSPQLPRLVPKDGKPPVLHADPAATQDVTQAAREVLRKLDGFIDANKDPLHNSITNIETVSASLARNTERFDRIMAGLENLTGGADGKGEIAKTAKDFQSAATTVQEAAKSVRTLSDNLDKRTAELSASLDRFTSSGLREFQSLAADGRQTLGEIQRAVKNLDRDPQRLIFGGSNGNVPEYRGRR